MFRWMYNTILRKKASINNIRYLPSKNLSDKSQIADVKTPPPSQEPVSPSIFARLHVPNKLERRILVWTKMYKSKEEIPQRVTVEQIEKARNKARIKISNYMMLATAIACVLVAMSGRRAAERGESLEKMNLDWHKQINEEAVKEKAAAAANTK